MNLEERMETFRATIFIAAIRKELNANKSENCNKDKALSMLRIDIATKGRRDWFLSLKEIPNEIKIAIFPSFGNTISKNP